MNSILTTPVQRQIPGLTGVRGFSALWVILYHVQRFSGHFSLEYFNWPVFEFGWVGVDLFFILSGFVLMHVHQRDFSSSVTSGRTLEFLKLRIFRIYPVSTVVLVFILISTLAIPGLANWYRSVHHAEDFTFLAFFKTLFLATRWIPPFRGDWNGPVWSLSVEFIGYFAFPILAHLACRIQDKAVLIGLLLLFVSFPICVFFWRHLEGENNVGTLSLFRVAGFFSAGIILYRVWEKFPIVSVHVSLLLITCTVALTITALTANLPWIFPIIFAIVIYCIAANTKWTSLLFGNRAAVFAGKLSFPLYLCHMHFLIIGAYIAQRFHLSGLISAALLIGCLGLACVMAWMLHVFVEVPAHKWARKFKSTGSA